MSDTESTWGQEEPDSVQIVLEPQEIPDERIEAWKDEWEDLTPGERGEYLHLNEFLEEQAKMWTSRFFTEMQAENDAHHMIDEFEVNYE